MAKDLKYVVQDASSIEGNAPLNVKEYLTGTVMAAMTSRDYGSAFAFTTGCRLKLKEISYVKNVEEPGRMVGRVVTEIEVDNDMVNSFVNMHGGCIAYLVDVCTTMAITTYELSVGKDGLPSVSQALNILYHSPAEIGDKLRIVSTTITVGARAMSAKCEIWNDTHHRQVATGVHTKMHASPPKVKAQL